MIPKLLKVSLLILISLIIAKPCFSVQKLKCATTNYPPYSIFDKSTDTFTGLDLDIVLPLFEQLGIEVDIVNLPWARLKKEIPKGDYDCYFSLGKFKDREQFLEYSNLPMHITSIAIFYIENQGGIDFSKKIVGVHRGINIHENIPPTYGIQSSTVHKLPSNEVLFKMLYTGRVDAVVTNKVVGKYILKQMDVNFSVDILDIEEYKLPVYLAFRKGVVDISQVNKMLLKIKTSTPSKL
jgi:ABC-type amino acid transport substrate-binding protein